MRTALAEKGFLPSADKEHGIRSSQCTQDNVDWADRVFYMDGGNERRLFKQFTKLNHAQRLSDYVDGANTVPNPGRCNDLSQHLRIVDMIVEAFPKIEQELI